MLKGIHPLLEPDLLRTLAAMGHGDEIVIVDANFPAESTARRLHRLPAVGTTEAAEAILSVLPLDSFVDEPVLRMEPGSPDAMPDNHAELHAAANAAEGREVAMGGVERFAFYERAAKAYAVVATGDLRPYGCFILVKGVIFE